MINEYKAKDILESCAIDAELKHNKEYADAFRLGKNCIGAIGQIKWERDIAIEQLKELGYELGQKIEH